MTFPLLHRLRVDVKLTHIAGADSHRVDHADLLVLADQVNALYEALNLAVDVLVAANVPWEDFDTTLASVRVALGGEA
jgi:hypothetical protein